MQIGTLALAAIVLVIVVVALWIFLRVARPGSSPETKYLCPHCKKMVDVSTKPKRSFMGFLKILCPICKNEFRYPLTPGYVAFYWLLLVFNIILIPYFIYELSQGQGFAPNPIGIVVLIFVIISLIKNAKLEQEIEVLKDTLPGEK